MGDLTNLVQATSQHSAPRLLEIVLSFNSLGHFLRKLDLLIGNAFFFSSAKLRVGKNAAVCTRAWIPRDDSMEKGNGK